MIEIKLPKSFDIYMPKLRDAVIHDNGKIGLIYEIKGVSIKVFVISALADVEEILHSKVVQQWDIKSVKPFKGEITIKND